jgi:hypothetical protein
MIEFYHQKRQRFEPWGGGWIRRVFCVMALRPQCHHLSFTNVPYALCWVACCLSWLWLKFATSSCDVSFDFRRKNGAMIMNYHLRTYGKRQPRIRAMGGSARPTHFVCVTLPSVHTSVAHSLIPPITMRVGHTLGVESEGNVFGGGVKCWAFFRRNTVTTRVKYYHPASSHFVNKRSA